MNILDRGQEEKMCGQSMDNGCRTEAEGIP